MVGHSGPPSQGEPEEAAIARTEARPSLEVIPDKSLELVRMESLEIVRESLELVRESLDLELERDASPEPPLAELLDLPNAAHVDPNPTPLVHTTTIATPDEISIPPAGDLMVEPVAERFFSEGEIVDGARGALDEEEDDDWDSASPRLAKAKRKASPEAVARRARFSRYVSFAVAGAAIVCVAAFVRSVALPTVASSARPVNAVSAAAPAKVEEAKPAEAKVEEAKPAEAKVEETKPAEAKVEEARPEEAKVAEAKPEGAKATDPAIAAAPPAEEARAVAPASDKSALDEKKASRRALERGKLDDSIAAGERSVALDATDGEAWLILGAAYQEKGKRNDARRCYAACLEQGKRGPLGECRAMLR